MPLSKYHFFKTNFYWRSFKKNCNHRVWEMVDFPIINLRSALAEAKQVYDFLFALRIYLIAFNEGLMPNCVLKAVI